MAYPRVAGPHIRPAGVAAAKSGPIRCCPATVKPREGTSQVDRAVPSERSPRRKGGSGGAAAGPPPSPDAEVFHVRTDHPAAPTLAALGRKRHAAELTRVEIGGHDLAMMIRGHSSDNPVLLFLAGGPGGTELGAMRRHL